MSLFLSEFSFLDIVSNYFFIIFNRCSSLFCLVIPTVPSFFHKILALHCLGNLANIIFIRFFFQLSEKYRSSSVSFCEEPNNLRLSDTFDLNRKYHEYSSNVVNETYNGSMSKDINQELSGLVTSTVIKTSKTFLSAVINNKYTAVRR